VDKLDAIVGESKVSSVTTDNAPNMEKAWGILESTRGLLCNGCAAHVLNLLLQDVAKMDEIKRVAAGAEAITAYFMGRQQLLAWRRSTRSKKKTKKAQEAEAQRKKKQELKAAVFQNVDNLVRDEDFWMKGEQVIQLLEPIIKKLQLLESDHCYISMAYWAFRDLLKQPIYCDPTFLVSTAKAILVQIEARWNKVHTDAMCIAFFLDPAQDPNGFVGKDRKNSKKQIRKMAKRLGYTPEEVDQAYHEAGVFWNLMRDWTPKQRRIESRSAPLEWWGDERDSYPVLSRIARRVFTMPTSSAASERNWSAHKFVYSDRRVNLGLDKINMLISMYWDRLEKPLPRVIFNPAILQTAVTSEGDDDEEENRIHYEAHDSDGEENYEHEVLA
ncbi:hypothetical protein PHYSODRAFT_498359, partial [Phytophthora sojae]